MAVATTSIAVASKGLVLIGADPIAAFDGSSRGAIVAEHIYDEVVEDVLVDTPWSFATAQENLSHLSEAPSSIWTDQWQIPPEALLIRRVTLNDTDIDYEIHGDKIFTLVDESNTLTMTFNFRALEQDWPPYFRFAVELKLASTFAMAIAGKPDMADDFETRAQIALRKARSNDGQADTAAAITTNRFILARR